MEDTEPKRNLRDHEDQTEQYSMIEDHSIPHKTLKYNTGTYIIVSTKTGPNKAGEGRGKNYART